MQKLHLIVVALFLLFSGCSSTPPQPKNTAGMPAWVMQPNLNGKIGAIGVAGRTYDQRISSQRKLAITRALDELSLQQGVTVELQMHKEEVVSNSRASINVQAKSSYTANNTVSANIQEVWIDRTSGEVYVWMVLDN